MKLRSPRLIRVVAALAAAVIWCWMRTTRIRVASVDGRVHPADPRAGRFLYAFWHEGLLAPLTTKIKVQILISQHADGELIAQVCHWLGYGTLRGSTTRGGCEAILGMMRSSAGDSHLGITPDGPKGPRRKLQLGMVLVASQTGIPIVLLGIGFGNARRFNSWDRFALPRPFSSICGVLSEPICVPPDLDRNGLNRWRDRLEERLNELNDVADDWAARCRREGRHAAPPRLDFPPARVDPSMAA